MRTSLLMGSLVGVVVGLLSWRGNQTAHLVSTFPDGLTFLTLAVLLPVVVALASCRTEQRGRSLRRGMTAALAAGVVFGAAIVGLGFLRFTYPAPVLLAYGFFTALASALACGLAVLVALRLSHQRTA
jgi:hypothetical protein